MINITETNKRAADELVREFYNLIYGVNLGYAIENDTIAYNDCIRASILCLEKQLEVAHACHDSSIPKLVQEMIVYYVRILTYLKSLL